MLCKSYKNFAEENLRMNLKLGLKQLQCVRGFKIIYVVYYEIHLRNIYT